MITVDAICRNCGISFKARAHDVKKGYGTSCSRACYFRSKKVKQVQERIWSKIEVLGNEECWPYKEKLNEHGYGVFHIKHKSLLAHRVIYQLSKGEIPAGMIIMHSCDNPSCCNPAHLTLGTQQDNIRDMNNKGRGVTPFGEKCHKSKLKESEVRKIRDLQGSKNHKELAEMFGVTPSNVLFILKKKTWKHVE